MKREQSLSWKAVCNSSFPYMATLASCVPVSIYKLWDMISKSVRLNYSDFLLYWRFVESVQKNSTNLFLTPRCLFP